MNSSRGGRVHSNTNSSVNQVLPTCCDFGSNRISLWPGFFFCHPCTLYENEMATGNSRCNRSQHKYKCTAGHTSFITPTTKISNWCRALKSNDKNTDVGSDSEDSNNIIVDEMDGNVEQQNMHRKTSNLRKYINDKKRVIQDLEINIDKLQKAYDNERSKSCKIRKRCGWDDNSQAMSLSCKISEAIDNILSTPPYNRYGSKRLKLEISVAIMDEQFLNGRVHNELMKGFIIKYRNGTYTARNILRAMDLSSGGLNLSAIEILRSAEGLSSRERGFLPSKGQIQNVQRILEKYARNLIPCKYQSTDDGECITFEAKELVRLVINSYQLNNIGKRRPLVWAVTSDGSKISNHLHIVIAGFKVVDIGAIDPITKKIIKPQTRNVCWPLRIVMGRETEAMYTNYINPVYNWWNACESVNSDNEIDENQHFPDLKPFNLCYANDMSAAWKLTKKGGCSKVAKFFCHCCDATSATLHIPNNEICTKCEEVCIKYPEKRNDWLCYCKELISSELLNNISSEYDNFRLSITNDIRDITSKSKLLTIDNDKSEATSSPYSIDYQWSNDAEKSTFMTLLFEEALLRNVNFVGKSLEDLRNELKDELFKECKLKELSEKLNHVTPAEGVKILILQMIPCILHMETRIGIKILCLILQDGLSNAKGGLLVGTSNVRSEQKREEIYKKRIENLINTSIIGNEINKYQYDLPLEDDPNGTGRRIGIINFENTKVRKILDNIHEIVEVSYPNNELKTVLNTAISSYSRAFLILRKKDENYTQEELLQYKVDMNYFSSVMIKIFGRKMFTNYFHFIVSGHIYEYMKEWGNLNRYSQQGWEALNSLIKSFFFRRTNKGGGKSTSKRSKLKPIGLLMQRRVLWMSGLADIILDAHYKDKNFSLEELVPYLCIKDNENDDSDSDTDDFEIHD